MEELELLTFFEAMEALREGEFVGREGWNGKDQFLFQLEFEEKVIGLEVAPCIALKNQQNIIQPGWVPSQGDIFADDWYIADVQIDVVEDDQKLDCDCNNDCKDCDCEK